MAEGSRPDPILFPPKSESNKDEVFRMGRFSIRRQIGRGAMAAVYDAIDTSTGKRVALKVLCSPPFADEEERRIEEQWFRREAELLAKVRHPNIVALYGAGRVGKRRYLVLEFVEGPTLAKACDSGEVDRHRMVQILLDVARAVSHAHSKGIIHRDLKPENILLDANGAPQVTDFGIAKGISPDMHYSLTQKGDLLGTPAYMSPEQARLPKEVDERTDVYSIGAMLYEHLAGRPPHIGKSPMQTLVKIGTDILVKPSRRAAGAGLPEVDPFIEEICLRALERERGRRTRSAEILAGDFSRWLIENPSTRCA